MQESGVAPTAGRGGRCQTQTRHAERLADDAMTAHDTPVLVIQTSYRLLMGLLPKTRFTIKKAFAKTKTKRRLLEIVVFVKTC